MTKNWNRLCKAGRAEQRRVPRRTTVNIEKFFDQPYTDRQLVEFVDNSKSEKKSLWVAILEDDKLFVASAAGIAGATGWISRPIGLAALGIEKLLNKSEPDIPNS